MSPNRTREWHERRLSGFGASEAPKLLGVSRYGTARRVVEEKARGIVEDADAPQRLRLRLGTELEPVLAQHAVELALERGLVGPAAARFRRSSKLYRMPGFGFVITNVDGFVGDALVELKTDEFGYEAWGDESGVPALSVPPAYYAQVQHALAATGRRRALLFVLIGLHERRLYEVPRDESFVADLLELESPYWAAVEEARRRLAADAEASIDDLLPDYQTPDERLAGIRKRHPADDGLVLPATAEQEQLIAALRVVRRSRDEAQSRVDDVESRLKEAIGDAAGLESSAGTITYKLSAASTSTDWHAVALELRQWLEALIEDDGGSIATSASVLDFLDGGSIATSASVLKVSKLDSARLDAIEAQHVKTTPGSRRFVVPRAWAKPADID